MKRILAIALILFSTACGLPEYMSGMILVPNTASAVVGTQVQFTAIGSFSRGAKTRDVTNSVTWVSSNPQIATVKNGLVQTLAVGQTTITASSHNGNGRSLVFASAELTVTPQLRQDTEPTIRSASF